MASIHITSSSKVVATNHNKQHPNIDFTPWDLKLLQASPIQRGLVFFKPNPPNSKPLDFPFIEHLKTSLSRTLNFFPPLAGRLVKLHHDNDTVSFSIHCNNEGAEFIHAVAHNITVSSIIEPVYVPQIVLSLFPLNGTKSYEGVTKPLLGVQVTELVDGIFIGCSMNHAIADGTSFWKFLNLWSTISRDLDHVPYRVPVFDRGFFDTIQYPIQLPLSFIKPHNYSPPPLKDRVFHFTKERISSLKAKANEEAGLVNKVSSFQALLAHIWRCMVRIRAHNKLEHDHYLIFPVGLRSRMKPPLSQEYFGNGFCTTMVSLKAKEITEGELGNVAVQIHKAISLQTHDKTRSDLESWNGNNQVQYKFDLSKLIVVGSSHRFDVYGNDFGWGKPVAARSGFGSNFDGKIIFFPGAEEGNVDVEIRSVTEALEAMENDSEFHGCCH